MKWIVAGLVLLLLGAWLQLGLLVFAMYVLLALLFLSRHLTAEWTDGLAVSRAGGCTEAQIGDTTRVTVTVRNRGRFLVPWLLLEDSLPWEAITKQPARLRLKGQTLQVTQLAARGERILAYDVEFQMRGYYQFGPILLESGDLFGLHRRFRVATQPHYVQVFPKIVPLEGYELASRRPMGEVRLTHRLFEDPTRIAGVRLYQRGDPLNRIHWRASARTGVWHSKRYESSCVAGATILLDFHQTSFGNDNPAYRAELAVTAAASIAHAVDQLGQQLGLVTNARDAAERIREEGSSQGFRTRAAAQAKASQRAPNDRLQPLVVETRRGAHQFERILDLLARVEMTDGFTFAQLVAQASSRLPRDSTLIAILPEVSEAASRALGQLRRSGYAVVAVLVMFGETAYYDWAQPPDWASRLLAEGVEFRRLDEEAGLARLCLEDLLYRRV